MENLINTFDAEFAASKDSLEKLEGMRVKFLGKNGLITAELKKLGSMNPDEKRQFGARVNEFKMKAEQQITERKVALEEVQLQAQLASEKIDITLPSRQGVLGRLHPISKVIQDVENIFAKLGFSSYDGLEIDDEWYNFSSLNIPDDHPARQMHDTFYLNNGKLLRTHTSNMQVRIMKAGKPPFKFINIGKVYRSDDDATHSPMFHQLEVVYVDKNVNIGHLKYTIETFLELFFEVESAPIRMRASHFPFTEPSAEVDVLCDRSQKNELVIGKGSDWLEILGCGMINPKVLENAGLDPNEYQGFALGCGIERLAMLKYNIPDLRRFFDSDLRWLNYYGF